MERRENESFTEWVIRLTDAHRVAQAMLGWRPEQLDELHDRMTILRSERNA